MSNQKTDRSPLRVAILISGRGRGSNFQAIVDACEGGACAAQVAALISLNPTAGAVERARKHGIPVEIVGPESFSSLEEIDREIADRIESHGCELICLAGYLRMFSPWFVQRFPNRIMNIHPALLPAFGGKGMYGRRVHEAVLEFGAKVTGVTVHFIDEEYDHGPIILQKCVAVDEDDTPEILAARVLTIEHELYSAAIDLFAKGRLKVEGRRVRILEEGE